MEKILDVIDSIANQRGLNTQTVRDALKIAYINSAKRVLGQRLEFDAILDDEKKAYRLYQEIEVVANDDERLKTEEKYGVISLKEALKIDEEAEVGDELKKEIGLEAFGRTAAMALHHELERALQKVTENAVYENYKSKVGKLINGVVERIDGEENTYIEIGEVRAVLPKKNRIKGEKFKVGETIKTVVRRVTMNIKDGIKIELSRTAPKFLEELLRLEVPEIADGSITIEKCARIPGERAKVALLSHKPYVDPVGATVGARGMRINAVGGELNGESIDAIDYSDRPEEFIARAMRPATVSKVICAEENKATVMIESAQKAKAIGKAGVNIRLASMLTGYEIELQEIDGASKEAKSEDASVLSALFNS
ncbi:MAG: transcription termination factor NusA [Helicobacteraceae bacterium]|nr:transcription termination factor NusA [Helicobacteraceae bacterium]